MKSWIMKGSGVNETDSARQWYVRGRKKESYVP